MSTSAQFAKLAAGELDIGLVREHPLGPELDAFQVVCEPLGVLVSAEVSAKLAGPNGIRLDALASLTWVSFPRSGSPRWYEEIVAILASHGVDAGPLVRRTWAAWPADSHRRDLGTFVAALGDSGGATT